MKKTLFIIWVTCLGLIPTLVSAHAFGQKYTLPLPMWLYVFGGGAVIIVSFLLIGYFATEPNPKNLYASIDLSRWKFFAALTKPITLAIIRLSGLILFVFTLMAGVLGSQISSDNFAPTFFWIIFLLGLTYLTAIVGNIWSVLNPWKTIALGLGDYKLFQYPKQLGFLPALIIYIFLIWLELLSGGAGVEPESLAMYLLWYTGITIAGSSLFGNKDWFYFGDFFNVFFRLIGMLAPITYREGKLKLRWPLVGLLDEKPENWSLLLFIIFMLSSTAYDGFRETAKAFKIITSMAVFSYQSKQLLILSGVTILFFLIYLLAILLMKVIAKNQSSIKELALSFGFSLIPIALAYNLAHYFTLLLVQGQRIIAATSDPFNRGWDLFGTADYMINIDVIGASTVWQAQVLFILLGHIAAVYVAHVLALRTFSSHSQAFLSQLPMLAVMVCYTMAGLWILAQPLIIG